jgi:hypothetical protein
VVDLAVLVEADGAVGVDQARDHPPAGDGLGAGLGLEGDAPGDQVQVTDLAVGEDRAAEALDRGHDPERIAFAVPAARLASGA